MVGNYQFLVPQRHILFIVAPPLISLVMMYLVKNRYFSCLQNDLICLSSGPWDVEKLEATMVCPGRLYIELLQR